MKAGGGAGKDRAALGTGLVTNGDRIGELFFRFEHVGNSFGLVSGDVDADFLHGFDNDWIEFTRFESGAVSIKLIAADLIQECFGHLAASAVVNADKKDVLFHGCISFCG